MKHLDLFSGIGGFALAARWMGWETVQFVEVDHFCQAVLRKNFNNVPIHGDIKTFSAAHLRGSIDVLTGGFPCQPFSSSGKRKGDTDDRHLWPEKLRIIREVRPKYIVGENVYGLLTWGKGVVFEQVQTDLENEGYQVQAFILPACAVNAPHKRDRIWIIAHTRPKHCALSVFKWRQGTTTYTNTNRPYERRFTSDSSSFRWVQSKSWDASKINYQDSERFSWERFPTQSPIRNGDDGIPTRLVRSAIKAGGNAIVPKVAFEIFKAIELL